MEVNDWAAPVQVRCARKTPDGAFVIDLRCLKDLNQQNRRLFTADRRDLLPDLALREEVIRLQNEAQNGKCCKQVTCEVSDTSNPGAPLSLLHRASSRMMGTGFFRVSERGGSERLFIIQAGRTLEAFGAFLEPFRKPQPR